MSVSGDTRLYHGATMPILLTCPSCGAKIRSAKDPASLTGRKLQCPGCNSPIVIPPPMPTGTTPAAPIDKGDRPEWLTHRAMLAGAVGLAVLLLATVGIGLLLVNKRHDGRRQEPRNAAERQADVLPGLPVVAAPKAAEEKKPLPQPAAIVTAYQLWEEYGDNALGTDARYKGKPVQVTGVVKKIQQADGRYFVGLEVIRRYFVTKYAYATMTPQERKWCDEGYPPNVICYIGQNGRDRFAKLKELDEVQIVGVCQGSKKDHDVWKGYIVILEDCILKEGPKVKPKAPVPGDGKN